MSFFGRWFGSSSAASSSAASSSDPAQPAGKDGVLDASMLKAEGGAKVPVDEERKNTLLSLLSSKLGMDVTSGISIPVSYCEPSSNLTRMTETFEYAEILMESVNMSPIERLACMALFVISGLSNCQRYFKPLNPLLGETFEYVDPRGFKFFAEQISHHPPISTSHCESKEFTAWQQAHIKTKFMGNTLELYPNGRASFFFHESGDLYRYTPPLSKLHNVIIGSTWMEFYGECKIENLTTGDICSLNVDPAGWFGSYTYGFNGICKTKNGLECIKVSGKWSESGEANWVSQAAKESYAKEEPTRQALPLSEFPDTVRVMAERLAATPGCPHTVAQPIQADLPLRVMLWAVPPGNFDFPFDMSEFAHHLCDLNEPEPCYATTDCRLRPDRRAVELALKERAVHYKGFLEEEQRKDRREAEAAFGKDFKWKPLWFKPIDEETYVYNGNYWEQSEQFHQKNKEATTSDLFCPEPIKGKAMDFHRYQFSQNPNNKVSQ
eukprot:TRINITY_DN23313_c0_g1_i1.p1 TRINITY_DN23313_c0_g1~~TRINITY_DN23313_c0_g1_i1.p1  ORF type:complete len:494 (-),score=66.22 TRINITY_DN23313_c0_g1_i1:78-1559(-)